MAEPHCSNFRIITAMFWGVRIFRNFTVCNESYVARLGLDLQSGVAADCHSELDYRGQNHLSHRMSKPTKSPVHPAKTEISLGICRV